MKTKLTLLLTTFVLFTCFAQAAKMESASVASTSSSAASGGDGGHHFGLGLSSVNVGALGASTMITGWIPINSKMGIQPYLGVLGTTGSFNFLAGGAFKATVAGTGATGLHIGGDVLLGSIASTFVCNFGGLFGIHYALHPSIMLSVDGGPQIGIAAGVANFSLQSVSSMLGASMIYFL